MRGAAAYEVLFARLAAERGGAFVPFTVLGDPDPETSLEILRTMARSGADALEVGMPFSDPVADGPAIQAASLRALSAGMSVAKAWEMIASIRAEFPSLPVGLLVYANLVFRPGAEAFYRRAAEAWVDSILVADAPLLESEPRERIAEAQGIAQVLIAPPNASVDRLRAVAARSRGYVYVTARPGVTGARQELSDDAALVIRRLREIGSAPPLLGFGISSPDHVRKALAMGAAGAISGSAVASIIERVHGHREAVMAEIASFVTAMSRSTGSDEKIHKKTS